MVNILDITPWSPWGFSRFNFYISLASFKLPTSDTFLSVHDYWSRFQIYEMCKFESHCSRGFFRWAWLAYIRKNADIRLPLWHHHTSMVSIWNRLTSELILFRWTTFVLLVSQSIVVEWKLTMVWFQAPWMAKQWSILTSILCWVHINTKQNSTTWYQ